MYNANAERAEGAEFFRFFRRGSLAESLAASSCAARSPLRAALQAARLTLVGWLVVSRWAASSCTTRPASAAHWPASERLTSSTDFTRFSNALTILFRLLFTCVTSALPRTPGAAVAAEASRPPKPRELQDSELLDQ